MKLENLNTQRIVHFIQEIQGKREPMKKKIDPLLVLAWLLLSIGTTMLMLIVLINL